MRRIGSTGHGRRSTARTCGRLGGRQNRPESGRSRTQRLEAPPDRLRARHAARDLAHGRQPQRHHADAAARGRDPGRARPSWPAAPPPAQAVWRSRLPLAPGTARAAPAWHLGEDRQARQSAWIRTRPRALGRRADDRLAPPVPAPRVRYERRDDIHEAFLAIGCSLICLKLLRAENSF